MSLMLLQPTTLPAIAPPAEVDPKLWASLVEANQKSESILRVSADFEQSKFTPLLKKPLISKGTIHASRTEMLWVTKSPSHTLMSIDAQSARIYYPGDKLLEEFPVAGQLGALGASPMPRLETLSQHFQFTTDPRGKTDESLLAVMLTPIDAALKEFVSEIHVTIDRSTGLAGQVEIVDRDGDRTVIRFLNAKINPAMDDSQLRIQPPPDVKIVRPMQTMPADRIR
jgi:outer membrane lipoprotein-sorting protein